MPISTSTPLRVAVIGCGNVSRGHIRGWLGEPERARVVALVDLAPHQAQARRDEAGLQDVDLLTDFRAALERDDVDAVDICTPGHLHAEQIAAALDAGKHVLTEKPTC